MNKEEIKYYLIECNKAPRFYAENEECKKIFLELLEEKYPYAIKIFVEAPAKFIDEWNAYKDKKFKLIVPLYNSVQTEKQQKEYYRKVFSNLTDKRSVLTCLENEFWKNSTLELLNFYKRLHKKLKDDKDLKTEIREFHGICLNKINEISKPLEDDKKKAISYFEIKESRIIKECLFSDTYTEERKEYVMRLLKKHAKYVFKEEYFRELLTKYKLMDWINVYVKTMIDNLKDTDLINNIILLLNSSIIKRIDEKLVDEMFKKIPDNSLPLVFEKINEMETFDKVFEYFTTTYNRPKEVIAYSKLYLTRFSESGEAILNVVTHVLSGRASVNSLPDLIEEYVKNWLLNYNFHNRENEICSVIDALSKVERLEELFYDFSFWKKMERCNAFISLIDSISYIVGFEDCYELIEKNYFAAKAYGESMLADKWMKAASVIAIHYEDAKRPYVLLISNLLSEDSNLDYRSKDILLKRNLIDILEHASNNKKRLDLEIQKSKELRNEYIQDVIFYMHEPLQKLEKAIMGFSNMEMGFDEEVMKSLRNMVAKIRQSLKMVGIFPIEDTDIWEKRKVIPFDSSVHICMEELRKGELVTCLSMGMKDEKEDFFEKATVKLYTGEKNHGNNV